MSNQRPSLLRLLSLNNAGGELARRFLPWGFLVPCALWGLRLVGQKYHLYSMEQGFALYSALTILFLMILIVRTALHLHDVDTKRAETKELLDSVIENIPNMIFLKDAKDLRFVLFNKAGEKLLGYARKDLLGKNDYDFFPKEQADFFVSKDREILKQNNPVDIPEEPIDTRQGKRYLHTQKIAIKDKKGQPQYLLGISEDITRQKEDQAKLEEQKQLLMYTSKMSALGEMAGGVAHEINNPLSVIYGEAEDLRELATEANLNFEQVARAAAKIEATTERISRIVKGLRTFARDSAKEPFLSVGLKQIVEDTLSFCRERFQNHGTQIQVDDIPHTVYLECRPVQVSQVLLNLLNNAFDATQDQPERKIRIQWKDSGETIELSVVDNGPGISNDIRDKIFQPFFTTKEVGRGTGLGLSIAAGIAEGHRGSLTVENLIYGKCAKFTLRLPRRQAETKILQAA